MPLIHRLARQREYGLLALLVLTIAVVTGVNHSFLSPGNIRDMLILNAPAAIVACGMTFVVVTGEIDISVGSLMGLLAAAMGILVSAKHMGLPVAAAIALTLLLGAAVGFINGMLVTYGRMPSIIVTLGMLTALQGLNELVMGGEWITDLPPGLRVLGTGNILGIPISVLTASVVVILSVILSQKTILGRRIYAAGSNAQATRLAGISLRKIKLIVFTMTGFLTGVATVVSVPELSVIESGVGKGFELLVVTCVVVGGASVSGGRGTIAGSLLAVLLLGIIRTVLIFLHLGEASVYWERAIQGAFILLAVLVDHIARRRSHGESGG